MGFRLVVQTALGLLVYVLAPLASAQTTTVFDEDDGGDAAVYEASEAAITTGGGDLELVGNFQMPLTTDAAKSGTASGRIRYTSEPLGAWRLLVGAPGFAELDLSSADSLSLFLNGPSGIPGVVLPSIALEDADGNSSAALALDFNTLVGFSRTGSRFLDGSSTNAQVSVEYVDILPADRVRPGYPETLRLTFASSVQDTSRAAIGIPAVEANFIVETDGGERLEFQFRDTDGDGTLSADGETITVLTLEEAGSTRFIPTWRITLTNGPSAPPTEGDVYQLAVFNGGVDSDPATWQRRGFSLSEFGPLSSLDLTRIRGVRFTNPLATTTERTLWIDALAAIEDASSPTGPPPPTEITTEGGDETVVVRWNPSDAAHGVIVFRRQGGGPFERLTDQAVREDVFFDLRALNGAEYTYVLRSVTGIGNVEGPDSEAVTGTAVEGAGDPYIDEVARRAFDYFWREANPANGLVKDRSRESSASSIAAVGFGLSAYTVGIDRGWITREQGVARTLATLEFFASCPQSNATSGVCGYKGFFYHFLNMQTGERAGTNELSTIDTALLLGGILHAAQVYDGESADESRIRELADLIWRRVDWNWAAPNSPLVALGWRPESGFIGFDWRGYNEAMILYVLGMGSPTHPLPDAAWEGWTAGYSGQWQTHYGISFLTFPPLFGHQYSHVWIDFRDIQDDYMRERSSATGTEVDYFENSRRATLAQRAYAIANPRRYPNYSAEEWGITASDIPGGYRARGAPPAQNDDGTLTPTAAGGSYAFTPDISRDALRTFYARHRARLWGQYGLRDAYNIDQNWFATDVLGIDQGPILLMIENERTEALWDAFMTHPDIQRGLERAGFQPTPVSEEAGADLNELALMPPAPNPATSQVQIRYALPAASSMQLSIHDVLGREVTVLQNGRQLEGVHTAEWNAENVAAGLYILRLESEGVVRTRRLVIMR
ncbi:MAG: hypothetical protein Rubg2KO_28690 [Rubricoccaceae bacterium]